MSPARACPPDQGGAEPLPAEKPLEGETSRPRVVSAEATAELGAVPATLLGPLPGPRAENGAAFGLGTFPLWRLNGDLEEGYDHAQPGGAEGTASVP